MRMLTKPKKILILIILVAAVLRLFDLGAADVITDEALNGFRSIGKIDFFVSEFQKTPYDWYGAGEIPGWVKLSYHDHPPLTFIVQNIFFKIGGINLWSLRLPFALAGIISIYLVYLIGKKLFSTNDPTFAKAAAGKHESENEGPRNINKGEMVGLVSAGLLAINSYHVWISRIGLMESIVIFLNLLTIYLFFKALEKKQYFIWLGISFGLAVLAKYTSLILGPIFLVYILIYRRDLFKSLYFYIRLAISLLIISPVIIYNAKLWQNFGHLDFQLSYLFGQSVPDWQFRLGRLQAGGFMDKLTDLLPSIARGVTPVFAVLVLLAVIYLVYRLIRGYRGNMEDKTDKTDKTDSYNFFVFIILVIAFHLLLFLAIGPRERFVAMVIPYLVLAVSYLLINLYLRLRQKKIMISVFFVILVFSVIYEVFFTYNTALAVNQWQGKEGISYSRLKFESLNWGYNELDQYLESAVYQDSYPAFQFPIRYGFLEDIKKKALDKAKAQGKLERKILLIYDKNINSSATVWYIFRPFVYGAWPFISADLYLQTLETEGQDFFRDQGMEEFVFIKATKNTLLRPEGELTQAAKDLEESLQNITPDIITHERVGKVFRVYWFE